MGRKLKQRGKAKLQGHDLIRVKGKLPAIQDRGQIEDIKDIYILEDAKSTFPTLYIHGKSKEFLGIVIARQSSDFLAMLAQKLVKNGKVSSEHPMAILQYPFPTYLVGMSLLAITPWGVPEDLDCIIMDLNVFQKAFRQKLFSISE